MGRLAAKIVPGPVQAEARPGAFPLMDTLRGFAALSIFAYHVGGELRPEEGLTKWLSQSLAIGVPVFFVISGFLLYRPFVLAALERRSMPPVVPYAWRRVLRIVPAFWVALAFVLLLGDQSVRGLEVVALFGFAQVYEPDLVQDGIGQAWSLNCEVVYYALIPLWLVVLGAWRASSAKQALRLQVLGIVVLLLASVLYKAWALGWGFQANPAGQAFIFQPGWNLDMFVFGMALAVWSAWVQVSGRPSRLEGLVTRRPGWFWLAAAALFAFVVARRDAFDTDAGILQIHTAEALFGVFLLLPAVAGPPLAGALRGRLLADRRLLGLGVISYGFYLWHLVVVEAVFAFEGPLESLPAAAADVVRVVAALAGSIGLACASWLIVERPALSLRGLVGGPPPVQPAGVAPAGARAVPVER